MTLLSNCSALNFAIRDILGGVCPFVYKTFAEIFRTVFQDELTVEKRGERFILTCKINENVSVKTDALSEAVEFLDLEQWNWFITDHDGKVVTIPFSFLTAKDIFTPIYEEAISGVRFDVALKQVHSGHENIGVLYDRYVMKLGELSTLFEEACIIITTNEYAETHPKECVNILMSFFERAK